MSTPVPLTAAQAQSLVAISEPWLSCDDCFDQVDGAIEALIHDGRSLDEPLRVHLARCTACWEEAESLVSLAAADLGVNAEQVLSALRTDVGLPADAGRTSKRKTGIRPRLPRIG